MSYTPRKTKEQREVILKEFDASGLTIKMFCEQHEINYASFVKWKQQRQSASATAKKPRSALVKVEPFSSGVGRAPKITLSLTNGGSLAWDDGVDPNYIASIIRLMP